MLYGVDLQLVADVSWQPLGLIFGCQANLENGTYRFSRNVGNWLPMYAVRHPRRTKISNTPRRKPPITHVVRSARREVFKPAWIRIQIFWPNYAVSNAYHFQPNTAWLPTRRPEFSNYMDIIESFIYPTDAL